MKGWAWDEASKLGLDGWDVDGMGWDGMEVEVEMAVGNAYACRMESQ